MMLPVFRPSTAPKPQICATFQAENRLWLAAQEVYCGAIVLPVGEAIRQSGFQSYVLSPGESP